MKTMAIAGERSGRLVAVSFSHKDKHHKSHWNYRCDCGRTTTASASAVRSGKISSCGCLRVEQARINGAHTPGPVTHGASSKGGTPEYHVWKSMRMRCSVAASEEDREAYFERGIRVCERWDDFQAFIDDMGSRPSPKHSLDRINNDLGYSPENCRWATSVQQANNRRPRSCFRRATSNTTTQKAAS